MKWLYLLRYSRSYLNRETSRTSQAQGRDNTDIVSQSVHLTKLEDWTREMRVWLRTPDCWDVHKREEARNTLLCYRQQVFLLPSQPQPKCHLRSSTSRAGQKPNTWKFYRSTGSRQNTPGKRGGNEKMLQRAFRILHYLLVNLPITHSFFFFF